MTSGYGTAMESRTHRNCDCLYKQGKERKDTRVGGRLIEKRRSIEVEEGLEKVVEVNVIQYKYDYLFFN